MAVDNGYVDIQPEDRLAHLSNPAFDAATFEVWGALLNGASVEPLDLRGGVLRQRDAGDQP